ncbi:MAG: Rieske 2Fe-2S domain-containing protein [Ferruginibacter sp.]
MNNQDNKWHKIAESIADLYLSPNGIAELEIKGKKVCISLYKEQLFACAAKCPHAGGKLTDGYVDMQGNIVCPLHRYKFSLQNGRNVSGEGYYLKTWPVEQRQDGIYIAIENKSFF